MNLPCSTCSPCKDVEPTMHNREPALCKPTKKLSFWGTTLLRIHVRTSKIARWKRNWRRSKGHLEEAGNRGAYDSRRGLAGWQLLYVEPKCQKWIFFGRVYCIIEQVMLDLLRKDIIPKTLDAREANASTPMQPRIGSREKADLQPIYDAGLDVCRTENRLHHRQSKFNNRKGVKEEVRVSHKRIWRYYLGITELIVIKKRGTSSYPALPTSIEDPYEKREDHHPERHSRSSNRQNESRTLRQCRIQKMMYKQHLIVTSATVEHRALRWRSWRLFYLKQLPSKAPWWGFGRVLFHPPSAMEK